MKNMPKRVIVKSKQKLRALIESRRTLRSKVNQIHDNQLRINHHQMLVSSETNDRLKNSGIVAISPDEMLVKVFTGLKMYLDPKDLTVAPHIALDSVWEHEITTAWLKVLRPDDVIFDVGANFGYFGALAGQKTGDRARIIYFEVNPKLLPYIRKTVAVNWLSAKSIVENLAVSDKEGKITLTLSPYYLGSASLSHELSDESYQHYKIASEELQKVTVPAVTIDTYCKEHQIKQIDLIKMDIEGFEERAYQGMRKMIKRSPDVSLFIEFTKENYRDPQGFYKQLLEDFGNVYSITKDGAIQRPRSTDYKTVIESSSGWIMPIFSKRDDLDKC